MRSEPTPFSPPADPLSLLDLERGLSPSEIDVLISEELSPTTSPSTSLSSSSTTQHACSAKCTKIATSTSRFFAPNGLKKCLRNIKKFFHGDIKTTPRVFAGAGLVVPEVLSVKGATKKLLSVSQQLYSDGDNQRVGIFTTEGGVVYDLTKDDYKKFSSFLNSKPKIVKARQLQGVYVTKDGWLLDSGASISMAPSSVALEDQKPTNIKISQVGSTILRATKVGKARLEHAYPAAAKYISLENVELEHKRRGHHHEQALIQVLRREGYKIPEYIRLQCLSCLRAKARRLPHPKKTSIISTAAGQFLSADIHDMGEENISLHGARYFLLIIDWFSRYLDFEPMAEKSEATALMTKMLHSSYALHGRYPFLFRRDNEKVLNTNDFKKLLASLGPGDDNSPAYDAASNGMIERPMETVFQGLSCNLLESSLSEAFWVFCRPLFHFCLQ